MRLRRNLLAAMLGVVVLSGYPIVAAAPQPQTPTWAFEETFESYGAPDAPLPFTSDRLQVLASGNDGLVTHGDGSITHEPIEAGHGPHCESPNSLSSPSTNNHLVNPVPEGGVRFEIEGRPQAVYICNEHMMTVVKSGYDVASFMPRQEFDFAGRTGTFQYDASLYSFGREWWDTYFVPEQDMLLDIVHINEGGTGEQLPRRAVRFSLNSGVPQVALIDNYQIVYEYKHWQQLWQALGGNDPALEDPSIRRTVKLQLSESTWSFSFEKYGGGFFTITGSFPQPLSFSRALARTEHHAYNPTKDGISGTPVSFYTFHWDNIRFDGPALAPIPYYAPAAPFFADSGGPPAHITVPSGVALRNVRLIGQTQSFLNDYDVDPQNASHWRQFRINGGVWQDLPLVKPFPVGSSGTRGDSTFRAPLVDSGLLAGDNTIEFRQNGRPLAASWQPDGFTVRDLEIQADATDVQAVATSTTALAMPSTTPTQNASPTATPTNLATLSPTASPAASPSSSASADPTVTATPITASATATPAPPVTATPPSHCEVQVTIDGTPGPRVAC